MKAAEAYGDLLRMERPIVTNREAAARWRAGEVTVSRRLRGMEEAGLIRRLRRGLWSLDPDIGPFAVAPFLTAPFPAYVSLWSALARHGLIEQMPRQVSVASLDRSRRIQTSIGTYAIHHLAPEVFGGFEGTEKKGYVATAEKALFDSVYVRAAAGGRAYFPELSLPRSFDRRAIGEWIERIESARLRTMVSRGVREALRGAGSE
jgi:predicted transcriptional regulator of viral defense system